MPTPRCRRGVLWNLGGLSSREAQNESENPESVMAATSEDEGLYSVAVRGRAQIAHSFKGELFGPAQALHGCTYVVDAVCKGPHLQPAANYLVDICAAEAALHAALEQYNHRNLDDVVEFSGDNTTCERIARAVWERVATALPGPPALTSLQIVVRESDVAHVEYEKSLAAGADDALYTVSVRGRFMAARLLGTGGAPVEGATFVVDALFSGPDLDPKATFLFDICLAEELVRTALAPLHQSNLSEAHAPAFGDQGRPPTASAIAQVVWEAIAKGLPDGHGLTHLKVVVREHDESSAEHSRPLSSTGGARAHAGGMSTVISSGRCMVAHSFKGEQFGPAQALHGCTYVVDARYSSARPEYAFESSPARTELVRRALAAYHQRNLDDLAEFSGENTTCERVARAVWCRVASSLPPSVDLSELEIVVRESDVAWVAYKRAPAPSSIRIWRGTTVALDLDSLTAQADAEAAAAAGSVADATPTGIVHANPLGALVGAMPNEIVAFSSVAWDDAKAAMARVCGLSPTAHNVRIVPRGEVMGDAASAHAVLTASTTTEAGLSPHRGIPRIGPTCTADRALLAALNCCSARADDGASRVAYLAAKRPIDKAAYSGHVLAALEAALAALLSVRRAAAPSRGIDVGDAPASTPSLASEQPLRVFDLGAGTLSMLPVITAAAERAGWPSVHYLAFDSDAALLDAARQSHKVLLESGGGRGIGGSGGDAGAKVRVQLELQQMDVRQLEGRVGADFAPADLLVASGFADLLPPAQLAALLPRLCPGGFAYLPITFAGTTRLEPPDQGAGSVPSDERVMAAYHAHLIAQGQFLDPAKLIDAVAAAGGSLVATGASPWRVAADAPFHLWMVDFLAGGTARAMWSQGWDPAAWRWRVLHERRPTVVAENVDLLLRLPQPGANRGNTGTGVQLPAAGGEAAARPTYGALEFAAPRRVHVVQKRLADHAPLAPNGVALRTVVSMISSGTELLIYRGAFDDSDEPLDATIEGLAEERLAYPMAYGYSLVGRVVQVGPRVPSSMLGSLVFAFAPHAAYAFTDAAGVQPVPRDISAADAAFLPAAETAISIAHDAHPRAGETVCVFGAGVIGLLLIATLHWCGAQVIAVDPDASRRKLAAAVGAARAVAPADAPRRAADVSVECSGSPAALQAALDATLDSGKVVVASWYGKKPVGLTLGTRFHRSHLEIVASQVSTITGPHAARWSKSRRFGAAWDLIRRVRPSTSLPLTTVPLERAPHAYDLLDKGAVSGVVEIEYGTGERIHEPAAPRCRF